MAFEHLCFLPVDSKCWLCHTDSHTPACFPRHAFRAPPLPPGKFLHMHQNRRTKP